MTTTTQVNYEGMHGEALIAIFPESVSFNVGDLFVHSTHKTQFNQKIDHPLPDGNYRVHERKWLLHQASVQAPYLMISITDL